MSTNEAAPNPFEPCPVCGRANRMTLLADWQEAGRPIPIVGCGNPWHYTNKDEASAGAVPRLAGRLRAEIAEEMAGPDNPDDLFEQGCLAAYNWVLSRLSEGTDR